MQAEERSNKIKLGFIALPIKAPLGILESMQFFTHPHSTVPCNILFTTEYDQTNTATYWMNIKNKSTLYAKLQLDSLFFHHTFHDYSLLPSYHFKDLTIKSLAISFANAQIREKFPNHETGEESAIMQVDVFLDEAVQRNWDRDFDGDSQFIEKYREVRFIISKLLESRDNTIRPIGSVKLEEEENEMNQNEILGSRTFDLLHYDFKESREPVGFNGKLKPYQGLALTWMLCRQNVLPQKQHHIFKDEGWKNLKLKLKCLEKDLFYHPNYNVLLSQEPMKCCSGGIIGDQMGLGKTIMMIALILANPGREKKISLVITPTTILDQWKEDIHRFAPHLNVGKYTGSNRNIEGLSEFDVLLVSESTLRSDFSQIKSEKRTIFDVEFHRIIIDQAQKFRNAKTKMAHAACSLHSTFKWCLSGTPAENSYSDLYSMVKFIGFKPWSSESKWQSMVPKNMSKKMTEKDHYVINAKPIQKMLKGIMIRRTKESKDSKGNSLINLPTLFENEYEVSMEENVKSVYSELRDLTVKKLFELEETEARAVNLEEMEKKDKFKFKKKIQELYDFIIAKITLMRQICCHSLLYRYQNHSVTYDKFVGEYEKFLKKKNIHSCSPYPWKVEKIRQIANKEPYKCQFCGEIPEFGLISECLHIYCKVCVETHMRSVLLEETEVVRYSFTFEESVQNVKPKNMKQKRKQFEFECEACKKKILYDHMFPTPRLNNFNREISDFQYNEKFLVIAQNLKALSPNDKVIVYTSFLGVVELLVETMRRQNINHIVMTGEDSSESRVKKIKLFGQEKDIQVFIMTLKVGSVGLNLQMANMVFILDPWWNPFQEEQAVSRVHRLGQERSVRVITFVTKGSIEERVKELKKKKKEVFHTLFNYDPEAHRQSYFSDCKKSRTYTKKEQLRFLLNYNNEDSEEMPMPPQNQLQVQDEEEEMIQTVKLEEEKPFKKREIPQANQIVALKVSREENKDDKSKDNYLEEKDDCRTF